MWEVGALACQDCHWHVLTLYEIEASVLCSFDRSLCVFSLPIAHKDPRVDAQQVLRRSSGSTGHCLGNSWSASCWPAQYCVPSGRQPSHQALLRNQRLHTVPKAADFDVMEVPAIV
jgi:hypothetical protein